MTPAQHSYLRNETLISVVINIALSGAFFLLVFGVAPPVSYWVATRGASGLAAVVTPLSLYVALLSPDTTQASNSPGWR